MSTTESITDDSRIERKAMDSDAFARLQEDLEQLETLYVVEHERAIRLESENTALRAKVTLLETLVAELKAGLVSP